MIKIPGTQQVTRKSAIKKAFVGSAVIAALTFNPLHALAHLPFAALKNKVACFKNPLLNVSTDIMTCLATDHLLHTITDTSGEIADTMASGGEIHGSHEHSYAETDYVYNSNNPYSEHINHSTNSHGITQEHLHEHNHQSVYDSHGDHDHNHAHGFDVALASSIAEEWQQLKTRIKNGRNKMKTRWKN